MACRMKALSLEGLCGNIEVADKTTEEKVITVCETLVNPYELRQKFACRNEFLKLDNAVMH